MYHDNFGQKNDKYNTKQKQIILMQNKTDLNFDAKQNSLKIFSGDFLFYRSAKNSLFLGCHEPNLSC